MGYIMQDTGGTLDILWDNTFFCYIVNILGFSLAINVAGFQESQYVIVRTASIWP